MGRERDWMIWLPPFHGKIPQFAKVFEKNSKYLTVISKRPLSIQKY